MAESQYTDVFRHQPLHDPKHAIRLLRLVRDSATDSEGQDAAIHCNLTTHSLAEAPEYMAVSYTWGDPTNDKTIRLNDKTSTVRQTCWYVLDQARQHGIEDYLWIDAICIDQKNDTEKSAQVARLGDIYRNAMQVNVCLGPHERDSAIFFEIATSLIYKTIL